MSRLQNWNRRLAAIGFAALAWGFFIEPALLFTRHHEAQPVGWPVALDGLKIAIVADLHAGSPFIKRRKVEAVVRRVEAENPDLIILLGDYVINGVVAGRFFAPEETAEILGRLHAPLGVYAVLGNHDWWTNGPRVRKALEDRGIKVLENDVVRLTWKGRAFDVLGLADLWTRTPKVSDPLNGIPAGDPVIAVIHEPDIFPDLPARISLTLAGHTHGGQVRLPLIGSPIVPSKFGQRYARGVIREGEKTMFVSTGIGTSILPVRFGVPPEVSILTVRAP